jgi:Fur family ferric uptake transcriptional regulator
LITEKERFSEFLKERGLKFTLERKAILAAIFSFHKHFDIEELYEKLRKQGEHLSRATIYRTLPLLIESDLINETLRCQGRISYEHTFGHKHHDHMVCIKCGRIIEFRSEEIEKLQEGMCKKYGFKPLEHRLGIKGYCKSCQTEIKDV